MARYSLVDADMDITGPGTAEAFLAAWHGQPSRGVLGAAIDGCMRAFRIMRADLRRYGVDTTADMREAAGVLRLGYRREFGAEYTAR